MRSASTTTAAAAALALGAAVLPAAAQKANAPIDSFEIVGSMGVSAQQLFLDVHNNVIVVDKTEANGNDFNIDGHPAWGSRWNITSNTDEPMDIVSNSFCAGGNVLADGTWLNVGGNQAITYGGLALDGSNPYDDSDGGKAIRTYKPCDTSTGATCDWDDDINGMTTRRWYPTLETLDDGSAIIIGGCDWGGYVNDAGQNNPTVEYYPAKGDGTPIGLNILTTTLPANLFALVWLLPSGRLFINANLGTELFDWKTSTEYQLDDIPHSVRTYPGSAATAMMPLTPANNWTATLWFCGGTDLQPDQWTLDWNIAAYPADDTCVSMTPDVNTTWVDEESLPEGRVMGNMIALPDGRFIILNGISKGTAGYGNTSWAVGQAFGTDPVYKPLYMDPTKPSGQRFYRDDMQASTIGRLYHSSATLLPDGSVLTSGSNPNADYVANGTDGYKWPTEYRTEYYYPSYYNERRPQPTGLPDTISYGGDYFNVSLSKDDVGDDSSVLSDTTVVLIRPGFSTHAINFGQRYVQLNSTAVYNEDDGTATLAVSQMPANPNILAPGPALIFVVVDGVPSIGQWVTVGNGKIGDQPTSAVAELPASSGFKARAKSDDAKASDGGQKNNKDSDKSPASRSTTVSFTLLGATSMVGLVLALLA